MERTWRDKGKNSWSWKGSAWSWRRKCFESPALNTKQTKKKRKRATICQQLKQWDDKTEPEAYLDNFELTMEEAEMPVKLWLELLRKQLTGKALTAYKEISLSPETPYLEVKQALLERMGATARQARRTYWLKKPKQDEGPESFLEQALRMITRVSTLMTTPQQVQRELFKGLIYHYFSEEAILLIEKCQEESLYRMSQEIVQLWQSKDGYARKKFMLGWRHPRPNYSIGDEMVATTREAIDGTREHHNHF